MNDPIAINGVLVTPPDSAIAAVLEPPAPPVERPWTWPYFHQPRPASADEPTAPDDAPTPGTP